ncbi:hypothetical protein HWV62_39782 [Athelia sp. TMB]|nr:hypothetical protein HWV62_39782 [Athelia sp. TMB]
MHDDSPEPAFKRQKIAEDSAYQVCQAVAPTVAEPGVESGVETASQIAAQTDVQIAAQVAVQTDEEAGMQTVAETDASIVSPTAASTFVPIVSPTAAPTAASTVIPIVSLNAAPPFTGFPTDAPTAAPPFTDSLTAALTAAPPIAFSDSLTATSTAAWNTGSIAGPIAASIAASITGPIAASSTVPTGIPPADDNIFNTFNGSARASTSESPAATFQRSIPQIPLPSSPSSSSNNDSSSPLAKRYTFSKPWNQMNSSPSPAGCHSLPHSSTLQKVHTTLIRLKTRCAVCWGSNLPNDGSHTVEACPYMTQSSDVLKHYSHFRGTIRAETRVCYGCYMPKVSASRALNCYADDAIQTPFSDSRDKRTALCHSERDPWSAYCSYRDTAPVLAWLITSNEYLMQRFRQSPAYCCKLDFDKGEDANYGPWLLMLCGAVDRPHTLTHIMRVVEFFVTLRGLPPP